MSASTLTWLKWPHLVVYKINWYILVGLNQIEIGLGLVLVQFLLLIQQKLFRPVILLLALLGFGIDYLMIQLDWMSLNISGFPFWLVMCWLQFVSILPYVHQWFSNQKLAALLGTIGGPIAYIAGQSLGSIDLNWKASVVHALIYGIFFYQFSSSQSRDSEVSH